MRSVRFLTADEMAVIAALVRVWNAYLKLPETTDNDRIAFMHHIHALQESVAARPVFEAINDEQQDKEQQS